MYCIKLNQGDFCDQWHSPALFSLSYHKGSICLFCSKVPLNFTLVSLPHLQLYNYPNSAALIGSLTFPLRLLTLSVFQCHPYAKKIIHIIFGHLGWAVYPRFITTTSILFHTFKSLKMYVYKTNNCTVKDFLVLVGWSWENSHRHSICSSLPLKPLHN